MTWPLSLRLTTAVADLGDPLLNVFIIDWDCHALLHAPWRIFDAPVFYPSKYPLAYSENMIAVAAAVLPFHAAGVPPIGVYNIAVLLGLTLSAYAGYVLAAVILSVSEGSVWRGGARNVLQGAAHPHRSFAHAQDDSAAFIAGLL